MKFLNELEFLYFLFCLFFKIINMSMNKSVSQVALVIKNLPANAGVSSDMGLIPGSGRFLGVRKGNSSILFF